MYEFMYYQVRDVMTSDPIAVDKHVTLSDVEAIFEEHDFNGLPVVDKSHRLIGLISKLDLLKAFAFTEKSKIPHYNAIMDQKISKVMTKDPRVVHPETPLTRVLQHMMTLVTRASLWSRMIALSGLWQGKISYEPCGRAGQAEIPARLIRPDMEGLLKPVNGMNHRETAFN